MLARAIPKKLEIVWEALREATEEHPRVCGLAVAFKILEVLTW